MENTNPSAESRTKKSTLVSILTYVSAVFLGLVGFVVTIVNPLVGIACFLIAIIVLPKTSQIVLERYKYKVSVLNKAFVIIVLLAPLLVIIIKNNPPVPFAVETKDAVPEDLPTVNKTPIEAQKELKSFLALSKKAQIINSYDFTVDRVIYVDRMWYSMTVTQKEHFLWNISNLKKISTGYHRFEARDAYSNEKVGEVTAFSGSVEVYK